MFSSPFNFFSQILSHQRLSDYLKLKTKPASLFLLYHLKKSRSFLRDNAPSEEVEVPFNKPSFHVNKRMTMPKIEADETNKSPAASNSVINKTTPNGHRNRTSSPLDSSRTDSSSAGTSSSTTSPMSTSKLRSFMLERGGPSGNTTASISTVDDETRSSGETEGFVNFSSLASQVDPNKGRQLNKVYNFKPAGYLPNNIPKTYRRSFGF
jgi:hypothetical protein